MKKMVFCDFKKIDASDEKSSINVGGGPPIGLSEKIKNFDIFYIPAILHRLKLCVHRPILAYFAVSEQQNGSNLALI